MQLSSSGLLPGIQERRFLSDRGLFLLIALLFGAIFVLDFRTGTAPVQHLYYIPIILSAYRFPWRGALASAFIAIALYHLASPALLSGESPEFDLLQVTLFLAVGGVTARLVSDAKKLRHLASTDDLTGLHNLRSFESILIAFVQESQRSHTPLAMLSLDVDRLKQVNDVHGHLAGARVVRTVGRVIAASIPPEAAACRYGGDEFAIVIPCDLSRAEATAANIRNAVSSAEPVFAGRTWPAGTLSISVGVACRTVEDPRASAEENGELLFRAADQALYRAKAEGRNRIASA